LFIFVNNNFLVFGVLVLVWTTFYATKILNFFKKAKRLTALSCIFADFETHFADFESHLMNLNGLLLFFRGFHLAYSKNIVILQKLNITL
jgi:hypothetical protein